jgi:hypothetical protein
VTSKKHAKPRRRQPAPSPRHGRRWARRLVVSVVVLIAVAAAVWWMSDNHRDDGTGLRSSDSAQVLVGRWQRTDAGYVIEIRSVDRHGGVDAGYFNPNPIHVSQALASDAGGALDLFIELWDVGYPGATYKLRYSPEHDALVGLYHQPTAGQDFEVAFKRK